MLRPTYPLLTERLLLRPFDDGDLDALSQMHGDPAVARYLPWEPLSSAEVAALLRRVESYVEIDADGSAIRLAAVLRGTDTVVGDYSLQLTSREHRQAEIGFVTHPDHLGHRYAREAVEALLGLAFGELAMHRVVGRCDPRNTASARLMERLGMRLEAHHRENERIKGEWWDELVYAVLADEWRLARARAPRGHRPQGAA